MVSTGLENAILNGLITGSFIALGAIGLSLVYNIADVPNFAHGELLMLGAYVALLVNVPGTVPGFRQLAEGPQTVTVAGLAVLFLLTAGSALALVYLVGGRPALEGSWWPSDPDPRVALGAHVAAASLLGALVVAGTPSILAGFLLSALVLAVLSPLFDRYVFRKFREESAALATLLIAAMGLSFVLRFTTQSFFGGTNRSYAIPSSASFLGTEFSVSAAMFFDFYVSTAGMAVEVIDTAPPDNPTIVLATYTWITGALLALGVVLAAGAAYRWRRAGLGEYTTTQTIGPRLVAALAGLVALFGLSVILATAGSAPGEPLYTTRIRTSVIRLSVLVMAIVLMTGLHVLLQETKLGKAMRASSDNLDLAKVTGINTDRVMMETWIIAGAFAAVGGIMIGILFHQIVPSMGFFRLLPMFAAVILGGLASVYGAILGSFMVGLAMEVGIYSLGISGTHRVTLAFVLLLAILLIRPEGIVGEG